MICTYSGPPIFGWPEPDHLSECEEGDDDAHVDDYLLVFTDDDSDNEDAIDEAEALVADRSIRRLCTIASKIRLIRVILETCLEFSHSLRGWPG